MKLVKEKSLNKTIPILACIVLFAIIAVIIILKLTGVFPSNKNERFIPAPTNYEFEETTVPAFPVEDVQVKETIPSKIDKKNEDEQSEEESTTIIKTYEYTQIPDLSTKISDYCNSLIKKDIGFTPIDDTNTKTELPSFDQTDGNVQLVLSANDTNNNFYSINLNWDTDKLKVILSKKEGILQTTEESNSMSLDDAVAYLYTLHPSVFNLTGNSMQEYLIITLDGIVFVGKTPCMRVNIYQLDDVTQTNKIAGKYIFSGSNNDLYQINPDNSIKQLNLA